MPKLTKRAKAVAELVDREKFYTVDEAVSVLKKCPTSKLDESIELAINLNLDVRQADQQVRGATVLPNGTGKTVRVAVFAKGDAATAAKKAGADIVGAEDLAEKIKKGEMDFDVCIASPDMMALVGQVGKLLGPKGLMPNPKVGTVTPNVAKAVEDAKGGQVQFRVEKQGIVHAGVGKKSFEEKKIAENVISFIDAIKAAKPSGAKGVYMSKVTLSSTFGPGLKIDLASLTK